MLYLDDPDFSRFPVNGTGSDGYARISRAQDFNDASNSDGLKAIDVLVTTLYFYNKQTLHDFLDPKIKSYVFRSEFLMLLPIIISHADC